MTSDPYDDLIAHIAEHGLPRPEDCTPWEVIRERNWKRLMSKKADMEKKPEIKIGDLVFKRGNRLTVTAFDKANGILLSNDVWVHSSELFRIDDVWAYIPPKPAPKEPPVANYEKRSCVSGHISYGPEDTNGTGQVYFNPDTLGEYTRSNWLDGEEAIELGMALIQAAFDAAQNRIRIRGGS